MRVVVLGAALAGLGAARGERLEALCAARTR